MNTLRYDSPCYLRFFVVGYNTDDVQTKFNKLIEKNADDDIDVVNKKLADLGRVSTISYR